MGKIAAPTPVKLIVPMLSRDERLLSVMGEVFSALFGSIDYCSPRLPFTETDYYERELGAGLLRRFLAFERLIDPGDLASIKVATNQLEEEWSEEGKRRVNLDPGYVTQAKLVLATTKNHGHRIYIGEGIYAEVTLAYCQKDFRPLPWTYPDYQSEAYLQVLREIRAIYREQLRARRASLYDQVDV